MSRGSAGDDARPVRSAAPAAPPSPRAAIIALALLAPVPSIGVIAAMIIAPGAVGQAIFVTCKIWLLVLPAAWHLTVERGRLGWSPPRRGGLLVGAGVGLAMGGAIVLAHAAFAAGRIDPAELEVVAQSIDLASPMPFLAGAAYWTLVNSLVEEYVYRWFVLRQCRAVMSDGAAVVAAAAIFTAHHVIALSLYLDATLTAIGSCAVFAGGATWSWMYLRYRSIWPGWISHVIVDIAVFAVGWWVLFSR